MGVKLVSSSAGSVELVAPVTASNYTATMPAGTGTVAVQGVSTNIVSGTAVASTSGTSIDFTGIPSWVKRITVMFNGVSTNGTSAIQIQLGSGSFTTSGYVGGAGRVTTASAAGSSLTTGFLIAVISAAADTQNGSFVITNLSGNIWTCQGSVFSSNYSATQTGAGLISLGGALDRVRITTSNGTDTFDAGSINILYE